MPYQRADSNSILSVNLGSDSFSKPLQLALQEKATENARLYLKNSLQTAQEKMQSQEDSKTLYRFFTKKTATVIPIVANSVSLQS